MVSFPVQDRAIDMMRATPTLSPGRPYRAPIENCVGAGQSRCFTVINNADFRLLTDTALLVITYPLLRKHPYPIDLVLLRTCKRNHVFR
jgi:hypothetical protein